MSHRLRTRTQRGLGRRPKTLRRRVLESMVARTARELILEQPDPAAPPRPATRGECAPCPTCEEYNALVSPPVVDILACGHRADRAVNHCRPCVHVSCRHNLYLDVKEGGYLRMNFPGPDGKGVELEELKETCSLDVADKGRHTHEVVGDLVNMHRERVRQIEAATLEKIFAAIEDVRTDFASRNLEPGTTSIGVRRPKEKHA